MSTLILRGGRVWNGIADTTTGASITIDGDRIEAVGAALGGPKELDVSGCTVVPGLIEGHAHLCFDATAGWRATYDSDTPGTMLARMAGNAQRMLAAGITTVRDLGAPTAASIELRESKGGKYLGVTLTVTATSREQLDEVYRTLSTHPMVKVVL